MKIDFKTSTACMALLLPTSSAFADTNAIEEIIVTGQKFQRSLQDTPASVAVVTDAQIEEQQLVDFYDILERTPNVNGILSTGFSIRGIDAFNVSGGGNSYLASVYVDGAPVPYRSIQSGAFSTWDVSQVEILRGPQSTLQGRNALAGAVIMNTLDPTHEPEGRIRIGAGEFGQRNGAIAFGSSLIEDQLAFRITAEKRESDGFNKNTTRNESSDYTDSRNVRAKFLYEPEALPGFAARLIISRSESEEGAPFINAPVTGSPFSQRIVDFNDPIFEYTDNESTSLQLDYQINDHWSVKSITTQGKDIYGYEWDGDASPAPGNILLNERTDKTLSQELRFSFDYDNFNGVVGLYYSNLDVDDISSGTRNISFDTLGVPTLLVAPPEFGGLGLPQTIADTVLAIYAPVNPVQLSTDFDSGQEVTTSAIFADFVYSVNDRWDIFGGARWDRESQKNASDSLVTVANAHLLPDPTNPAFDPMSAALITGLNATLLQMAADASGVEPATDADFREFLPKFGASYHWSDDLTTSLSIQRGYRSGGVGSNIAQSSNFTYDPEYTWNYELSLRSTWLDGRLVANANLFYVDWKDQQVTVQLSSNRYDRETVNVGSSTVKGFEAEFTYIPTSEFEIYGGIGYSKTEFTKFQVNQPTVSYDLSGRPFATAPEWTANLGTTWRSESGFFANININYADDAKAIVNPYIDGRTAGDPLFDPSNDARTLVNARFGYEWDNYGIYLIGTNLLDKEYVTQANTGNNASATSPGSMTLGAPRQFSVNLQANF